MVPPVAVCWAWASHVATMVGAVSVSGVVQDPPWPPSDAVPASDGLPPESFVAPSGPASEALLTGADVPQPGAAAPPAASTRAASCPILMGWDDTAGPPAPGRRSTTGNPPRALFPSGL